MNHNEAMGMVMQGFRGPVENHEEWSDDVTAAISAYLTAHGVQPGRLAELVEKSRALADVAERNTWDGAEWDAAISGVRACLIGGNG